MAVAAKSVKSDMHDQNTAKNKLTREEWVEAAWAALVHGSVEDIKVDVLAKELGVSRGSFYWHFKKREDLITAVLDRWIGQLGVSDRITPLCGQTQEPGEKLWIMYEYVVKNISGPQSIILRSWTKMPARLRKYIVEEDKRRLDIVSGLFEELGFDAEASARWANIYLSLIVSEFLRNGSRPLKERLAAARAQHQIIVSRSA